MDYIYLTFAEEERKLLPKARTQKSKKLYQAHALAIEALQRATDRCICIHKSCSYCDAEAIALKTLREVLK